MIRCPWKLEQLLSHSYEYRVVQQWWGVDGNEDPTGPWPQSTMIHVARQFHRYRRHLSVPDWSLVPVQDQNHLPTGSLIWVPEVLEKFRNVVPKHIIHCLYHLGLDFVKLVEAIPTQDLFEVLHVGEIPCWKMVFPLHLFHQTAVVVQTMKITWNRDLRKCFTCIQ